MGRRRRRLFSPKNKDLSCNRFHKTNTTSNSTEEPPTMAPVTLKQEPAVESPNPVVKEVKREVKEEVVEKPTTTRKKKPTTTRKRRTTKATAKKEKSLTTKED